MTAKNGLTSRLGTGTAMGLPQIAALTPLPTKTVIMHTIVRKGSRLGLKDPTPEDLERERRIRAIAHSVKRQIEEISHRYGSIVKIVDVTPPSTNYWMRLTIIMLAYGVHGVPQDVHRHFEISPEGEIDEKSIAARIEAEYTRFFATQQEIAARYGGRVRQWTEKDVDLSLYRIEVPVWRFIREKMGKETNSFIRRMLLQGSDVSRDLLRVHANRDMGDLDVKTSRGLIRGDFSISQGDQKITWAKGSLKIVGLKIADTLAQALRGERLDAVVRHPLLEGDLVITSAEESSRKRSNGQIVVSTVFSTKCTTMEIPL